MSFVPFLLMKYGAFSMCASFSVGFLLKRFSATRLVYSSLLVEVILFSTLKFAWMPNSDDPSWYFSAYSAGFGLCIGLGRSLVSQVYSELYSSDTAAGMALLGSGEAVSSCILFGLGDATFPLVKICLTLFFGIFGTFLYHAAWNMKDEDKRYYKKS